MRKLIAGALLAAALWASGTASADSPWRNLRRSLPIARAAWPTSQCLGREQVTITSSDIPPNAVAYADMDGSCIVHIRPLHDPYDFCDTLVHEFGHLAETVAPDGTITLPDGRLTDSIGHTNDGTVMDADGAFYKPCEAVGPPITARAAAASLYDLPDSKCKFITKKRARERIYLCGKRHYVIVYLFTDGDVDYADEYQPR